MSRQAVWWVVAGVVGTLVLAGLLYLLFGVPPGEAGGAGAGAATLLVFAAKQRQEAVDAARAAQTGLQELSEGVSVRAASVREQEEEITDGARRMTPEDKAREGNLLFTPTPVHKEGDEA